MFGLANSEGNHGEDVKEYWFYLDCDAHPFLPEVPVQVPAARLPVQRPRGHQRPPRQARDGVRAARHRRVRRGPLLRRGRGVRQGIADRHPDAGHRVQPRAGPRHAAPAAHAVVSQHLVVGRRVTAAADSRRGRRDQPRGRPTTSSASGGCVAAPDADLLFCENETNNQRLFGMPNASPYVKDGINDYVVNGIAGRGESGAHGHASWRPSRARARARRGEVDPAAADAPTPRATARAGHDRRARTSRSTRSMNARRTEADRFYAAVMPDTLTADQAMVMRQALAGMLWSKQYYEYDVHHWLREHGVDPWDSERPGQRGAQRRVVPHGGRRHHLDARQVGVPVVRRLGSGLPLRAAVAGRRRLRQGAGRAAAAHALHAPQRTDPGLRVELLRTSTRR